MKTRGRAPEPADRPAKPAAPTRLPRLLADGTFAVEADEVHWDEDVEAWVCTYYTDDPDIHEDFREWMAVYRPATGWEPDEV